MTKCNQLTHLAIKGLRRGLAIKPPNNSKQTDGFTVCRVYNLYLLITSCD